MSKSGRRATDESGESGQYSGQCSIYNLIDGLDDATDQRDLIRKLKKILNRMAYAVVTGESAANESHERWHTIFTTRLHQDSGKEKPVTAAKPHTSASAAPRPGKPPAASSLTPALQQILKGTHTSLHEDDGDGDDDDLNDDD